MQGTKCKMQTLVCNLYMSDFFCTFAAEMIYEGINIEITRKRMRTMRLSVKPDGRVCASVPMAASEQAVLDFIKANFQWIIRNQQKVQKRLEQQVKLNYSNNEEHLLWGRLLPLRIEDERGRESVAFYEDEIVLYCHPDRSVAERKKLLYQGYYQQFLPVLQRMLNDWGERLTAEMSVFERLANPNKYKGFEISVRLMKTEWGSCTPRKRHMTFNVDMARLPKECMEYVVIHELTHIDHCDHSPAFWNLCDRRLASVGLADSKTMRKRIKEIIRSCGGD